MDGHNWKSMWMETKASSVYMDVDNLPERVPTGPSGSLYLMDLEVWMETLAYVTG